MINLCEKANFITAFRLMMSLTKVGTTSGKPMHLTNLRGTEFIVSGNCAIAFHLANHLADFQGKIVGRGVLIDYFTYAQQQGKAYLPYKQESISAQDLEDCAKAQGLTFEQGDILFIRMGYVQWFDKATDQERKEALQTFECVGVKQSLEEVKWLW